MTIDVRLTEPHEWRAAADTFRAALVSPPQSDAEWARDDLPASWRDSLSVSAWDGARCVGHAAGFPLPTVVPGGAVVSMSGVTRVGVQQTHTRLGILTQLMQRLLSEARSRGAVLAGLHASETTIYGRFGFAVAGDACDVEIDVRHGARVVAPVAPGRIRLLARDEMLSTVVAVHERVGLDRPGAVARPQWMHERFLTDALGTAKAAFVVVHSDEQGVDDGWARYTTEWTEGFGLLMQRGTCEVHDVWGATAQVELALWKYILELDLVDTVRATERPVDDAVRYALSNSRAYHAVARFDEQWLRLLDVEAAMAARTFNPAQDSVTIAITDPLFPSNDGTWRVSAPGAERLGGAADRADLVTDVNGLAAAYLGGTAWYELAIAGAVTECTAGALAIADSLFASRPLPRCGSLY
ncbi:MAG: GNAT family N-acetyltransferase [Ilumatobacteraceae bacterium]